MWQHELERVAPRLGQAKSGSAGARHDQVDAPGTAWRAHVQTLLRHQGTLAGAAASPESAAVGAGHGGAGGATKTDSKMLQMRKALEQAAATIAADLERVGMQESRLLAQHETQVAERREILARERLARPLLDSAQNSVDSKATELAALQEHVAELEDSVKQRGDVMTDSSSLISIKKALAKIQAELQDMELRMGMLSAELLRKSVTAQGYRE